MTRKAAVLFAATSVIWGSSFLFIRIAVEHLPPSAVVFGRTALGTVFLVPLAMRKHAFRGLRRAVLPVLVVTALDMALPTFLTAWGGAGRPRDRQHGPGLLAVLPADRRTDRRRLRTPRTVSAGMDEGGLGRGASTAWASAGQMRAPVTEGG